MILKKHYLEKLTVIFAIKEDYDHREVYYYENRRFEGELHMYYDDKKQQLESIERFKNGKMCDRNHIDLNQFNKGIIFASNVEQLAGR